MIPRKVRYWGVGSAPKRPVCRPCEKYIYGSRKEARQIMKNTYPGEELNAYRCDQGNWHIGHTPWYVKRPAS